MHKVIFGGIALKNQKERTRKKTSFIVPLPQELILPLEINYGLPLIPLCQIGDMVEKGMCIADSNNPMASPLHSPTSGKITAIEKRSVVSTTTDAALSIVITPDTTERWINLPEPKQYEQYDTDAMLAIIHRSGIVGMGGSGFPTDIKLREALKHKVDTLIINAAECDPYITCDERLLAEKPSYIVNGTNMIAHAVGAKQSILAINSSMVEVIDKMTSLKNTDIKIVVVPSVYPIGSEKQLVQQITGKQVPDDKWPLHIGVVVQNVATAGAVYRALTRGEAIISRYVTCTGTIPDAKNLQVLIGTPIKHCLEICGFEDDPNSIVLAGGTMNGIPVKDLNAPITKTMAALIVTKGPPPSMHSYPCIQCGKCIEVCPIRLMPQRIYQASKAEKHTLAEKEQLMQCIECGCCDYVCPSYLPLVETFRKEKNILRQSKVASCDIQSVSYSRKKKDALIKKNLPRGVSLENKKQFIKQAVQRDVNRIEKTFFTKD